MNDILEIAKETAKSAGQEILKYYKGDLDTKYRKGEPVTIADLASEKVIRNQLAIFDFGYLSEEAKGKQEAFSHSTYWIVDPLDGTSDFVKQTGEFSVMIALVKKKKLYLGMVYQPAIQTTYWAVIGQGAYRQIGNSEPESLKVSDSTSVDDWQALVSRSHLQEADTNYFKKLGIDKQRPYGGTAKICLIAAQQGDIYINTSNKTGIWDTAAPEVILREAGGTITDLNGQPLCYTGPEIKNKKGYLASNGVIHDKLIPAY